MVLPLVLSIVTAARGATKTPDSSAPTLAVRALGWLVYHCTSNSLGSVARSLYPAVQTPRLLQTPREFEAEFPGKNAEFAVLQ